MRGEKKKIGAENQIEIRIWSKKTKFLPQFLKIFKSGSSQFFFLLVQKIDSNHSRAEGRLFRSDATDFNILSIFKRWSFLWAPDWLSKLKLSESQFLNGTWALVERLSWYIPWHVWPSIKQSSLKFVVLLVEIQTYCIKFSLFCVFHWAKKEYESFFIQRVAQAMTNLPPFSDTSLQDVLRPLQPRAQGHL